MAIDPALSNTRNVLIPAIVAILVVFLAFVAWKASESSTMAGGGEEAAPPASQPADRADHAVGYGDPIAMP